MDKKQVKSILMSMRTPENEEKVNYLLGKIDIMEESEIQQRLETIGNTEESVREFLTKKISENDQDNQKLPINEDVAYGIFGNCFTYGISDNCIHLHFPIDLHESLKREGPSKTMARVNLYLLDAIDRIKELKDDGFYKFQNKDVIYMISPALIRPEIKFLRELDFTTQIYKKSELADDTFVAHNPEAMLAVHIFGKNSNVGTASIDFDTINSPEWQAKKKQVIKELESKGVNINSKQKE